QLDPGIEAAREQREIDLDRRAAGRRNVLEPRPIDVVGIVGSMPEPAMMVDVILSVGGEIVEQRQRQKVAADRVVHPRVPGNVLVGRIMQKYDERALPRTQYGDGDGEQPG